MAMRECYVVGIRPPSNVERLFVEVEDSLFRSRGMVSALALPPLVALSGFETAPPPPPPFGEAVRLSAHGWMLSGRSLFARIAPEDWVDRVAGHVLACAVRKGAAPMEAPFTVVKGLYLSEEAEEALLPELQTPPQLPWSPEELTCLRVRWLDSAMWWEHVATEEVWRSPLLARQARS
jgi:hypothetical protein